MPPRGVKKGSKRGRQYEHIKDSLEKRGTSEGKAEAALISLYGCLTHGTPPVGIAPAS